MKRTCAIWLLLACVCRAEDVRKYGAVYDDASAAAIAKNDKAIFDLQSYLPLSGGSIDLQPGSLHISKTIKNPTRWQPTGAVAWRPIHFAIDGKINSRIVMHQGPVLAPAIDFSPAYPAWPYPDRNLRLRLQSVTIEGGGVKLVGGGKFTVLRELRVTGADVGIDAKWFDGGCLDDVYCYGNRIGGRFDTCMLLQGVRATFRENAETGLIVRNCNAWSGQWYCESNGGLQVDTEGLRESVLNLWLEDPKTRTLWRQRHCTGNAFSGKLMGIDADPISRLLNRTLTGLDQYPPIGEPVGSFVDFMAYGGMPLLTQDGQTVVCKPGCYSQGGQRYGELRGFDPTYSHAWKAGDYAQATCDIIVDQATLDWCGSDTPLMLSFLGGTFQPQHNVRLTGLTTRIVMPPAMAASDGKSLRLFVTLLGQREQPVELRFRFQNLVVRYLENR